MLLKIGGHVIQVAYDGVEAVAKSADFKPDMVLLDIGLPKMNGYDACRAIREQPWRKDVVIVALTGWGPRTQIAVAESPAKCCVVNF